MLPPKLILAPIDFSEPSRDALNVAADMASRFGADLLLVHVVPAVSDLPAAVSIFKEGEYDQSLATTVRVRRYAGSEKHQGADGTGNCE